MEVSRSDEDQKLDQGGQRGSEAYLEDERRSKRWEFQRNWCESRFGHPGWIWLVLDNDELDSQGG
jgi:hypothetical protein